MKPGYVGMLPGECMQQQQAWAPAGTPTDQVPQPHSVMSSHPSSNQPITQQMSEIAQSPVTSHNADSVNSADRMYMTSKSLFFNYSRYHVQVSGVFKLKIYLSKATSFFAENSGFFISLIHIYILVK